MTHLTFPKPGPKQKKPKAYIKRTSRPARKKRPNRISPSPARQAELVADAKWSRAVLAKGPCAAIGAWWVRVGKKLHGIEHVNCFGQIDPAHIVSRRYKATREDVSNGLPLCRRAHDFFGAHPKVWEAWVRLEIGELEYEALRLKALAGPKGKV